MAQSNNSSGYQRLDDDHALSRESYPFSHSEDGRSTLQESDPFAHGEGDDAARQESDQSLRSKGNHTTPQESDQFSPDEHPRTPTSLLWQSFWWLLTLILCALIAGTVKAYKQDGNITAGQKSTFSSIITGLILALGLNFFVCHPSHALVEMRQRLIDPCHHRKCSSLSPKQLEGGY